MLARITDRKIPCVYIHVYRITKNWGPGPYNSLHHADNRKYFSGLSLTRNRREAHMFYLAREVGKIWRCSCWEKGNFIMINEFKYGQTWHIFKVYQYVLYDLVTFVQFKRCKNTHGGMSPLKNWRLRLLKVILLDGCF